MIWLENLYFTSFLNLRGRRHGTVCVREKCLPIGKAIKSGGTKQKGPSKLIKGF